MLRLPDSLDSRISALIYMAFLFLVAYLVAFFVRPHEWFVLINENSTIIRTSLILCMGFFVFARRKNFDNPQLLLVTSLTLTVVTSLVASGWVGGAILYGQEFVQQVPIYSREWAAKYCGKTVFCFPCGYRCVSVNGS